MKLHFSLLTFLLFLTACSDWNDDGTETIPSGMTQPEEQQEGIAFSATVVSSQLATDTRANASLVNRLETALPATADRTYYVMNSEGTVVPKTDTYSVGIFGCYTEQHTWASLTTQANMGAGEIDALTEDEKAERLKVLNDYYTANFLYNQKADINNDGTLTYAPIRFWPNLKTGSQYDRVTFWAYYPYNETVGSGSVGQYGISIVPTSSGVGESLGMGKISYTMDKDAGEHSDFMISDLQADGSKDQYPLLDKGIPSRVPLRFHHMLAQVRLYAWMTGADKMVYAKSANGTLKVTAVTANTVTLSDGTTTTEYTDVYDKYVDRYGNTKTLAVGDSLPDDTPWLTAKGVVTEVKTQRWVRTANEDQNGNKTAEGKLTMSFNNIYTSALFTPTYDAGTGKTTFPYVNQGSLSSTTVNHYIQNPYWFRFDENKKRVMLNDTYMYDYFEGTPAATGTTSVDNIDGIDWSGKGENCLGYDIDNGDGHAGKELLDRSGKPANTGKHYNYAPGNIILAVPQVLNDNNVPNITITARGTLGTYTWDGSAYTVTPGTAASGKVTINLLNMAIRWESGFIYCYAYVDELSPGDDKLVGPESITVVFDPSRQTDQW